MDPTDQGPDSDGVPGPEDGPAYDEDNAGGDDAVGGGYDAPAAGGGGGYDDDDSGSDIDPESEILRPVQKRIEAQLRKQLEELALTLKETTTELKRVKQKREDTGAELYNVQQHLAKLQESLEKGHDNCQAVERLRVEKEREREDVFKQFEENKGKIEAMRRKYFKYQAELDKLSETLLRVEQFNEQIRSEISVEQRATYTAEDAIKKLEGQKLKQDYLVDSLNEQIKSKTQQLALLTSQLASQAEETALARDTLAEALAEMEAIQFEKKQLLQQWKTSLIGMQRRDETLQVTEEALAQQKEQLMALDNEIIGYRHSIRKEQEKNEQVTQTLAKTENEVNFVERQIDTLLEKKQKANDKFTMMKRSLDHTDAETKKVEAELKAVTSEIANVASRHQKASRDVQEMENKVLETLSAQTTLKKGSQSALQEIERKKNVIREKELQVTQMENELSRVRIDTLQTQSHNEVLKGTLTELENELKARDQLIEKFQLDIRRKHDEIERKQKALDQLNRQYDAIMGQQGTDDGGEGVGPLEATINNLSKAITAKSVENDALQRDWIRSQTELVNTKTKASELSKAIQELNAQSTILTQKRVRLTNNAQLQKKEIRKLDEKIESMHLLQKKLNDLLSKNSRAQELLANDNFNIETDLIKRLKQRKQEAIELEEKIYGIKEAKKQIMNDILDAERNVMFWEKKIQIAKETELALDPMVGKEEINRMKREIYIMEQRLQNLKKEQKRKVEEMEKQIDHREVLRAKGQAVQAATGSGQRAKTKATLQKENQRLVTELKAKKIEAQKRDQQIKDCLNNTERTALEIEQLEAEVLNLNQNLDGLQTETNAKTLDRMKAQDERERKQRSLQTLLDAQKQPFRPPPPEELQRRRALLEQQREHIHQSVSELRLMFPQQAAELMEIVSDL
ncbi:Coiled-coil domain-containing protein 40-like protein [Diplonema papillatum]|nr:Coiled-coil domain-containing protein 40-like protein [Diplonema papillatum]